MNPKPSLIIHHGHDQKLTPVPGRWLRWHDAEAGKFQHLGPDSEVDFCHQESRLSWRNRVLIFSVRAAGSAAAARGTTGAFITELWQGDVAELFLGNPETGRYLEVNLSPSGAWWACLMDGVRQPINPAGWPIPKAGTHAEKNGSFWSADLHFPALSVLQALQVESLPELTGNVTFVCRGPQFDLFASAAPLDGDKPDFHQPQSWLNICEEN